MSMSLEKNFKGVYVEAAASTALCPLKTRTGSKCTPCGFRDQNRTEGQNDREQDWAQSKVI